MKSDAPSILSASPGHTLCFMIESAPVLAAIQAEYLIVAGVILLLFGGTQIPKLARSLGQAKKEFESGQDEKSKKGTGAEAEKDDKSE